MSAAPAVRLVAGDGWSDGGAHRDKLLRYGRAHQRAEAMGWYLTLTAGQSPVPRPDLERRAAKLKGCGAWLTFRDYFTVGEVRLTSATFCQQDKLCPLCAIRRGGRFLRAYSDRILALRMERPDLRFWLLTITVKDGPDLAERFDHLDGSWRRLLQRRRDAAKGTSRTELAKVLGGVSSIEVKRGKGSGLWHPHLHAVVASVEDLGDSSHRWPALAQEWHDLTGDSFVIDVRPLHDQDNPAGDLCEVFKYALKFADLDLADNLEAFLILHGRHLVRPFGIFWGVKVPEDLRDEPLAADLPFVELLYRYGGGDGYRLVRERSVGSDLITVDGGDASERL